MKLVITIDTEEDNWGEYRTTGHTLKNIDKIPGLQTLFDEFEVKPTYLVTYPVATDKKAIGILKAIGDSGRCEIGTHCHPWNTPPFEEETNERNSMLCNLPGELQFKKVSHLHETIEKNFGMRPVSFRAGRWGYNTTLAQNLARFNYVIDTSVTAYTNWQPYHGPDFSNISPDPYCIRMNHGFKDVTLVELPATVGYLQSSFTLCNFSTTLFTSKPWSRLKVHSLLRRLNLVNKVSLSPELANAENMIRLTKTLIRKKYRFINMFFHSPSLTAGLSPFVKTKQQEITFLSTIRDFLLFLRSNGIGSMKLSEVSSHIASVSGK